MSEAAARRRDDAEGVVAARGSVRSRSSEADPADIDTVRELLGLAMRPAASAPDGPGAIGLESEHLVFHVQPGGAPGPRVSLDELTGMLDDHPGLEVEAPADASLTGWRARDGARLVPEPGAQIEYAGVPHPTLSAAVDAMEAMTADLAGFLDTRGTCLVSAGLDLWHHPMSVRQQLRIPRYPAMHAYFAARSPHGHTMMTSTASLQLNLDLGAPDVATERWIATILASPFATAAFACSPGPGAASGRALVWQGLDPTRTGIPRSFMRGSNDPVAVMTEAALGADVLLFRTPGGAEPGEPGFTLARWLADGHPRHGRPGRADVAYHLTTLFPEVRARGYLEIRSVDSLPRRWRVVPAVLYAGLLYDDRTRRRVIELLNPHRAALGQLLRRAATIGAADPQVCALAVEVWTAAAEGAGRLPDGYIDPADIQRAQSFLDRFTLRGRSPGDELRERFADGEAAALDWAREPAGSLQLC